MEEFSFISIKIDEAKQKGLIGVEVHNILNHIILKLYKEDERQYRIKNDIEDSNKIKKIEEKNRKKPKLEDLSVIDLSVIDGVSDEIIFLKEKERIAFNLSIT